MGRAARTARLHRVLDKIKTSRGCALHQPAMFACQLDLHHLDRITKEFDINRIGNNGPAQIIKEIQKCCVLRKDVHTALEHGDIRLPPDVETIKLTNEELAALYAAARPPRSTPTPIVYEAPPINLDNVIRKLTTLVNPED